MNYIENYIDYLRIFRYSSFTIASYKNILLYFYKYYQENYLNLKYSDFCNYILDLKNRGYSNSTLNKHISVLRCFYNYLVKKKIIDSSYIKFLSFYKVSSKLDVINQTDINVLLNINNFSSDFIGIRNLLILELLYSTGIRVNELINIKLSDVNIYDCRILVLGKGQKERYVIFGSKCKLLIIKYLAFRIQFLSGFDSEYLLLNLKKNKLSTSGIRYIINKVAKNLNIHKHLYPHLFRHTIASHLHEKGADTEFIQQFLGHSKIETTAHYVYVSFEAVKNTYYKCHARGMMKGCDIMKKMDFFSIYDLVKSKSIVFYVENNYIYCKSLITDERFVVGEC